MPDGTFVPAHPERILLKGKSCRGGMHESPFDVNDLTAILDLLLFILYFPIYYYLEIYNLKWQIRNTTTPSSTT